MSEYFKQEVCKEIFNKKYCLNGEKNVEEVFKGIAKDIALAETSTEAIDKWEDKFYTEMAEQRLFPAGRVLANARVDTKMRYYSNCYTIDAEDSIDGIYNALKDDAIISSTGGGVGINVSNIRPKGALISKGGDSSGVISFLKVFNESAKVIHTGGNRRAAHIAILNVDHPEIKEFITCKQGEKNETLTQFNISVGITDKFMEAVEQDLPWDLVFDGEVYETIQAKTLYDLLSQNSFTHNEPGVFNLDTVERYNNGYWELKMDRVNPCFTGDTIVAVADGRNGVPIKELAEKDSPFIVYSAKEKNNKGKWKTEIKEAVAFKTGTKEVIDIILSDGSSFRCTPEHKLALHSGEYIEAKDSIGKQLEKFYSFSNKNSHKSYRHINSKSNGYAKQYRMLWEHYHGEYNGKTHNIDHFDDDSTNDFLTNLKLITVEDHKKITKRTGKYNPINRMSYEDRSIHNRHKNVLANAKRYNWGTERILREQERLPDLPEKRDHNVDLSYDVFVEDIRFTGITEDVYDITVEDNHNFYIITETDDEKYLNSCGVLVHNCGEIVMPSYSVCCLSSLNLPAFVTNAFTDRADFDFEQFEKSIKIGIRFLDNVLSRTKYPLDKIERMSLDWRRVGLGFTGLGDVFAMLGHTYGDEASKSLSHIIGMSLKQFSYEASLDLAKEKGAFPKCDNAKLIQANFIKDNFNSAFKAEVLQYGLRNIGLNTIAPTGTTSLSIGNNCSSGIEPIFSLQYDRNIRTGRGDETKKETVYDKAWLDYIAFIGEEPDTLPEFFKTTADISPKDGIAIQAIFQKYIDHSISKTINIPPGTTFDEYKDMYMLAYKAGLKGMTSFNPDGSMKGILEYSSKTTKPTEERISPARPDSLDCDIYVTKVKGEEFKVVVGLLNGQPYEVFATKKQHDVKNGAKGTIVKKKRGWYDLYIDGELKVENLSAIYDAEYGEVTRMISLMLRHKEHGIPLQFIVEQMLKGKGFVSFNKAVARELKKYIGKEEEVLSSEKCPDCGADLIYIDGCKSCSNFCGWSKCS